jgi:hypothetical protein
MQLKQEGKCVFWVFDMIARKQICFVFLDLIKDEN